MAVKEKGLDNIVAKEAVKKEVVNDNDIISIDNINIGKTGSLLDDIKKIEVTLEETPDIKLQEIYIKETGNFLELSPTIINIPIEMIVFPFFTPQKQNKRVNFKYYFEDMGVTMYSTLVSKNANDKVFQPSVLEEKIYTYLISMYEAKKDFNLDDEDYIEFEISDFIVNFLGNKMNRVYYTKIEQGLKNLKSTEYQFTISNHTKLGKYKFEDEEFKLLTYQKLKKGKKVYYRVTLNKNIRNKIKDKRYIKYNSKNLLEILTKDPIAARIYKYISKIRYESVEGSINIRTLAAIIPLQIEQVTERDTKKGVKVYVLNRIKQVLSRIAKAFDALVELEYILEYNSRFVSEEDTYYIDYIFNQEKDNQCHISTYLLSDKSEKANNLKKITDRKSEKAKSNIKTTKDIEEAIIIDDIHKKTVNNIEKNKVKFINNTDLPDNLYKTVIKTKRNTYVQKSWNKRVDNKILKMYREEGKEFTKEILTILGNSLNGNIQTTLVQYINGIIKNYKKRNVNTNQNLTLFSNVKGLKSKKMINQARKGYIRKIVHTNLSDMENKFLDEPERLSEVAMQEEDEDTIEKLLSKYDEYTREEIENKAILLFQKETKESANFIFKIKATSKSVYKLIIDKYIREVIDSEYEKTTANDN